MTRIPERTRVWMVAGFAALLVLIFVWSLGPSLFAGAEGPDERVVQATVTRPVACNQANGTETVSFSVGGDRREATLQACGHDKGEKVEVAVPMELGSGAITARAAGTETGNHGLRKPVGLLLVALSCLGGAVYAILVIRGGRAFWPPVGRSGGLARIA